MIIYGALVYIFGALINIHDFSNGRMLTRPIQSIYVECGTLNTTDAIIIDRLKNLTLGYWPWECLNSRFNSSTFNSLISNASSLHNAAREGYVGIVHYYGEKMETNLSEQNEDGDTPLHVAVHNGQSLIVKYIAPKISRTDFNKKNKIHLTPLMSAAYYGQLEILKYLLSDIIEADTNYDEGDRSLLLRIAALSGNLVVLQYLVDAKNYTVYREDSELLVASAEGGNLDLIKYLIYAKNLKETGTQGDTGDTGLHKAAGSAGNLEVVKFFTDTLHYSVDVLNRKNATPAHSAAKGGNLFVIRFLIDERNANLNGQNYHGQSLLHEAASHGRLDIVKYLVDEKKVDAEVTDLWWKTPIHRAVRENHLDVVKYLAVDRGVSLSVRGKDGYNLLHQAVYSKNVEMMKYLLDDLKMIDRIDEVDESLHRTPASHAAFWGQLAILKFLIEDRHANTSIVDWEGKSLLHVAAEGGEFEIVKYLVEERNFDVNAKIPNGQTVYDFAIVANFNSVDEYPLFKYLREKMNPALLPKN